MWAIFKLNVLSKMLTGEFGKDPDAFAEFYADEYDKCIKRGGDMVNGVPIMNGNKVAFATALKSALKKCVESGGENVNILQELYPCFDAYWSGAEMAPIPNPLLKPAGWQSTPPAPGTIMNIGPNPIPLAISATIHKAEVETMKALEDELKKQTITIPGVAPLPSITLNVYETVQKILNKEEVPTDIKNNPIIKTAKEIVFKLKQAKAKKPSIGAQIKKAIKIPFPELPKRKKIIEEAETKLIEEAVKQIKETIIPPIEDLILAPIQQYIEVAVTLMDSIPNPKPTKKEIKKFVKDTINGVIPDIELPGITIPKLPTKEELLQQIDAKTPTEEEIRAMAYDKIKGLIPNIPFFNIVPPNIKWSTKTNVLIDPFISMAQLHLMGTSGNMMVMAQYPPPAPPAPAIINWSGYQVQNGPPVPDFPATVKIPEVDLGSIEIPTFPELPELPTLSPADLVASLAISLPELPTPTIKTPSIPGVG